MTPVPDLFWAVLAGVFGAVIGSFLNVVVWRLPRGQSLMDPPRSYCPRCKHVLGAAENIPLLSFLAQGGRCRACREPIPWRYFWVELACAALFVAITERFGPTLDTVAYCAFGALLLAALFIDLELYVIPDELNTLALLVGVSRDVWGAAAGEPNHALLWGWLPRSVLGAMVCASVFVAIQVLGRALFHKDAMGDGDVKLARAIGAMMPLRLALVSFLLAIGVGAVLGGALVLLQAIRRPAAAETGARDAQDEEPEATPLAEILRYGLYYVAFVDLLIAAAARVGVAPARRAAARWAAEAPPDEEDDFVPGPTHIPFGPYMVVGAFLALFVGDRLIAWYLAWAGLGPRGA
ncbi:MAG: prepilin peptidase [Chthonomonadales bacterium]|nr:prepilin peptidase [Chthonomonadales bacterium]